MTDGKEAGIVAALAIGIPALIAFHEYSTYLSSPYTTQKLGANDPDDHRVVMKLFAEATAATLIWTFAVGYALARGMGDWRVLWGALASAGFVAAWVYFDYSRALNGEL